MQISRRLWASKRECDAHICLNLGFRSQNFRLTQVSSHVCYFWSTPFRMDEGNTLPGERVLSPRDGTTLDRIHGREKVVEIQELIALLTWLQIPEL